MDGFDVLGSRPERRIAFTGELLAETQDAELQRIVELAAADLTAPMALVTLVLDQIQFFKAHYGLPADLAAARGTHRDVSFCQLVVRDEQKLEVTDAPNDTRVPQHVVTEYDINAYLGVPIHVGDVVVGSLCVLDTEPRAFTDEEHATLERLAESVDERVLALSERRRSVRAELTAEAIGPALTELRESVEPVRSGTEAGIPAMAAIRSYLELSEFVLAGGSARPAAVRLSLDAAKAAVEEADDVLYDIQASADDCDDCVVALEHLLTSARSTQLSEVLRASQDLARHRTRPVGNVPLPDGAYDPVIYTPRPLAVAFLTSLLVNTDDRHDRFVGHVTLSASRQATDAFEGGRSGCAGVDVGAIQPEQGRMPVVSVPIPVWNWLAALSVVGGRDLVGWWSGWRLPRPYSVPTTASGVMT